MKTARVLIVDDSAPLVELTAFALAAAAFTVDAVTDPSHARAKIAAFQPDLILMDVQMPGIDGLELTRQLKADPATQHIVVLAFTAFAMKGDQAMIMKAGCDGYIAKPFDVATLAATVHGHLAHLRA